MAGNPEYRIIYVIWAFFECILFGGLVYGWGSLVFVLKEDSVYGYFCPEDTNSTMNTVPPELQTTTIDSNKTDESNYMSKHEKTCREQESMLSLVFTIGSLFFGIGCAVLGQISFKFGTRVTRLCGL